MTFAPIEPETLAGRDGPETEVIGRQLTRRLEARLHALPDKQRAAFILARFEGLSHQEIADALQTSVSATKSLIHRALEALRAEVRAEESTQLAWGAQR